MDLRKKLAALDQELFIVEQNLLNTLIEELGKEAPGDWFLDWLKSKPDEHFMCIELSDRGSASSLSAR